MRKAKITCLFCSPHFATYTRRFLLVPPYAPGGAMDQNPLRPLRPTCTPLQKQFVTRPGERLENRGRRRLLAWSEAFETTPKSDSKVLTISRYGHVLSGVASEPLRLVAQWTPIWIAPHCAQAQRNPIKPARYLALWTTSQCCEIEPMPKPGLRLFPATPPGNALASNIGR